MPAGPGHCQHCCASKGVAALQHGQARFKLSDSHPPPFHSNLVPMFLDHHLCCWPMAAWFPTTVVSKSRRCGGFIATPLTGPMAPSIAPPAPVMLTWAASELVPIVPIASRLLHVLDVGDASEPHPATKPPSHQPHTLPSDRDHARLGNSSRICPVF